MPELNKLCSFPFPFASNLLSVPERNHKTKTELPSSPSLPFSTAATFLFSSPHISGVASIPTRVPRTLFFSFLCLERESMTDKSCCRFNMHLCNQSRNACTVYVLLRLLVLWAFIKTTSVLFSPRRPLPLVPFLASASARKFAPPLPPSFRSSQRDLHFFFRRQGKRKKETSNGCFFSRRLISVEEAAAKKTDCHLGLSFFVVWLSCQFPPCHRKAPW